MDNTNGVKRRIKLPDRRQPGLCSHENLQFNDSGSVAISVYFLTPCLNVQQQFSSIQFQYVDMLYLLRHCFRIIRDIVEKLQINERLNHEVGAVLRKKSRFSYRNPKTKADIKLLILGLFLKF